MKEVVKTKMHLDPELGQMLNEQKDNELYNKRLYSEMSNWFGRKGLLLLSRYYKKRSKEEQHHHDWIVKYLTECEYPISYESSSEIKETWKDDLEPFDITIMAELKTTVDICEIAAKALAINDYKTYEVLLVKLLKEQHEEEMISCKIRDIANQDCDWLTKETVIMQTYEEYQ